MGIQDNPKAPLAALLLARTPEAMSALMGDIPVTRAALKPELLTAIGEPLEGAPFTLTDEAVLQIHIAHDAAKHTNGDRPTGLMVLPLGDFLERDYPPPEALLGTPADHLFLARGTFLLLYGDGGAGKSTLTIDAVAHLAAGRDWLNITVPRPVRTLLIENEGSAGLFQTKLQDKVDQWDCSYNWRENVFVYAEPWGGFTFADPAMREQLRMVCAVYQIDLIVANPLFGIGGPGSGKPEETSLFVDWLKEAGLWTGGPALWLLHHENKLGQVSGDWARQPDTVISLEQDGDAPRSKLTWEKVRWTGTPPEGWRKKILLDWEPEHKGYTLLDIDLTGVTDSQLLSRIDTYLEEHPWSSGTTITGAVKGNGRRQRELLKEGAKTGHYQTETGSRRAILYALAQEPPRDSVLPLKTESDTLDANPDEHTDPLRPTPRTESGAHSEQGSLTPSSVLPLKGTESKDRVAEQEDPDADIPF